MTKWLIAVLLLAGCSATTTQTALVSSGQTLIGVGNAFVQVGKIYTDNCLPAAKFPSLTTFCAGYKDFAPKFQQAYPPAVQAWKIARQGNDASQALAAQDTIIQLSTELTALAVQVLGNVQ